MHNDELVADPLLLGDASALQPPDVAAPTVVVPPDHAAEAVTDPHAGGLRELAKLAWPLILSSSFLTIQFFLDAVFLTWYHTDAAGAVMVSAVLFWTFFVLLQTTTN